MEDAPGGVASPKDLTHLATKGKYGRSSLLWKHFEKLHCRMVSLYEILDKMTISFTEFRCLIMTQFMAAMLQKNCLSKRLLHELLANHFQVRASRGEQWSGTGGGGGASLESSRKWCKNCGIWDGDQRANQLNNWTAVTLTGIGTGAKQPDKTNSCLAETLKGIRNWIAPPPGKLFKTPQVLDKLQPPYSNLSLPSILLFFFPTCMFLCFPCWGESKYLSGNFHIPPIEKETHLSKYPWMGYVSFLGGNFTNLWYQSNFKWKFLQNLFTA